MKNITQPIYMLNIKPKRLLLPQLLNSCLLFIRAMDSIAASCVLITEIGEQSRFDSLSFSLFFPAKCLRPHACEEHCVNKH